VLLLNVRYLTTMFRRKTEAHINSFPNFMAKVTDDDGTPYDVHFVGLFSSKKDAVPLVMAHGWPGTFLVLPWTTILSNPEN
jgi:Epoxide hydrolase N terminus